MQKYHITLDHVKEWAITHAIQIAEQGSGTQRIAGVPRGGLFPAAVLAAELQKFPHLNIQLVDVRESPDIIVDDIVDSGRTQARYAISNPDATFLPIVNKLTDERFKPFWVVFPWEVTDAGTDTGAHDAVVRMMQYIGEDVTREGLLETPARVVKAWGEWFGGYKQDPKDLFKVFEDGAEGCDQMVTVHNIPVFSHCEHHITPIVGIAHVSYIPNKKIVGLSKLARIVNVYARRLQVQERLTNQVADAIQENLSPVGVGVIIRARHFCMATRGANIPASVTTTSAMRGALLENAATRSEFLELCRVAENDKGF